METQQVIVDDSAWPLEPSRAIPRSWYERAVDVVARDLLGCLLVSQRQDDLAAGVIVETEAYGDEADPASHASFRRNGAVRAMYGPAGSLYVYRAYGMYPCFNVVAGPSGLASAVLVRAIAPIHGLERMAARQGKQPGSRIASGPGLLGRALAVSLDDNERPLDRPPLWIQRGARPTAVVTGPRIGITRGTERPWRFGIANHPALSRRFPGG